MIHSLSIWKKNSFIDRIFTIIGHTVIQKENNTDYINNYQFENITILNTYVDINDTNPTSEKITVVNHEEMFSSIID